MVLHSEHSSSPACTGEHDCPLHSTTRAMAIAQRVAASDEVITLVREALALAGRAGYLEGAVAYSPTVTDEAMRNAQSTQRQATIAQASAFNALYSILSR